jgi:hypothetical protein
MTWIRTVPPAEAEGDLRRRYAELYAMFPAEYAAEVPAVTRPDGTADSIVAAHSLLPEVMYHMSAGYGELLSPELPLSRRQHEMIATLVSTLNRCFY